MECFPVSVRPVLVRWVIRPYFIFLSGMKVFDSDISSRCHCDGYTSKKLKGVIPAFTLPIPCINSCISGATPSSVFIHHHAAMSNESKLSTFYAVYVHHVFYQSVGIRFFMKHTEWSAIPTAFRFVGVLSCMDSSRALSWNGHYPQGCI